jgi:cytosine deaminase
MTQYYPLSWACQIETALVPLSAIPYDGGMSEYGDQEYLREAIREARRGREEGGVPIGSVLVRDGEIIGRGRNRRVQDGDPVTHAEIDCLRSAGRQPQGYRGTTLYSTLMPCYLCAGAVLQFRIPRVVVGEEESFPGARQLMEAHGVEVVNLRNGECRQLMEEFIREKPEIWGEDIGE